MKTRNIIIGVGIAVSVALAGTPPAGAQNLTFAYEGDVSSIDPPMDTVFQPGDVIRLRFTFDPSTPDSDPSPANGLYADAVVAGVISGPGFGDVVLDGTVTVTDGAVDQFYVEGDLTGAALAGCIAASYQLRLADASGTVFDDDSLPLSPPLPAEFNTQSIETRFQCGPDLAAVLTFPVRRLIAFDTFETGDLSGWSSVSR